MTGQTHDRCIEPDCTSGAFDEGLCLKHWDETRKEAKIKEVIKPSKTEKLSLGGERKTPICSVCGCDPAEAKPRWNKKQGQCESHIISARNKQKRLNKKALENDKDYILTCALDTCFNAIEKGKNLYCEVHTLPNKTPKKKRQPKIEPELRLDTDIRIDLDDYPDIFNNVKELAKEQIRSIPHQIIFILKDYFEVAEELSSDCKIQGCDKPQYPFGKYPHFKDLCKKHGEEAGLS